MTVVVAFAGLLLVSVLLSGLAHRSILSTAVVFLVGGFLLGDGVLGVITVHPDDQAVATLAELALFSVLFTDGMKVTAKDLRSAQKLPGRALLFGLPITLVLTALFAHVVANLPWMQAFLVGAVLSPTDPVFASALVGRLEVPYRLRHLLNVESGLNDGLALPVVVVLLAITARDPIHVPRLVTDLVGGVVLGIAISWAAVRLERLAVFSTTSLYEPLNAFAIGLLVLGVASVSGANEFLAAFAAGVTVATLSEPIRSAFHRFGELVAELLKLAALLLFGALMSPRFLGDIPLKGYVFAVLALVVARPLGIVIAMIGTDLSRRERTAAAWFGPKGFASVVYGLLVLESGIASRDELFHLIAVVIALSIVAHASTDVLIARWFDADNSDTMARAPDPG